MNTGSKLLLWGGCLLAAVVVAVLLRPATQRGTQVLERRESEADRILAEMPQKLSEASRLAAATKTGRWCEQVAKAGWIQPGSFVAEYRGNGRYRVTYQAGPGPQAPPGPADRRLVVVWQVDLVAQSATVERQSNPFAAVP